MACITLFSSLPQLLSALTSYMMHWFFLGKLRVGQLVKKFNAFYGIPCFITPVHSNLPVYLTKRQSVVIRPETQNKGYGQANQT
jgi:hypothetical protein